jgi:hypothetical protein
MRPAAAVAVLMLGGVCLGQHSASYQLTESGFSAGGVALSSSKYQITLQSAGQGASGIALMGPSYSMDGGFAASFPPAGEVRNLGFDDAVTLIWDPEGSVGDYNLYRGGLGHPFDANYGACLQPGLTGETAIDSDTPVTGAAFFYLVTARNRLAEEGTKGFDSAGVEHANPVPCP